MPGSRKNKDFNPNHCPVTHCLNRIGGKWKIMIIYGISKNCNRFSLLLKAIPDISKQTLVNQLRELETDQIVERLVCREVPLRVEYRVTSYGQSLMPVIALMQEWGLKDMARIKKDI